MYQANRSWLISGDDFPTPSPKKGRNPSCKMVSKPRQG